MRFSRRVWIFFPLFRTLFPSLHFIYIYIVFECAVVWKMKNQSLQTKQNAVHFMTYISVFNVTALLLASLNFSYIFFSSSFPICVRTYSEDEKWRSLYCACKHIQTNGRCNVYITNTKFLAISILSWQLSSNKRDYTNSNSNSSSCNKSTRNITDDKRT